MSGRRAKSIRRRVYGDFSLRNRKYYRHTKTGQVLTDNLRQTYQHAKKTPSPPGRGRGEGES